MFFRTQGFQIIRGDQYRREVQEILDNYTVLELFRFHVGPTDETQKIPRYTSSYWTKHGLKLYETLYRETETRFYVVYNSYDEEFYTEETQVSVVSITSYKSPMKKTCPSLLELVRVSYHIHPTTHQVQPPNILNHENI